MFHVLCKIDLFKHINQNMIFLLVIQFIKGIKMTNLLLKTLEVFSSNILGLSHDNLSFLTLILKEESVFFFFLNIIQI